MEQVINAERIEQVISVFGSFDENIKKIEEAFQVRVVNRGTELKVSGDDEPVLQAARAIELLLELASKGEDIDEQKVRYLIEQVRNGTADQVRQMSKDVICITAKGKPIRAKTLGQEKYVKAILHNTITVGVGPAGTGKTYLAVAAAVAAFRAKEVNRIILTRPAVEAGERLGFLPGDLQNKVDPYLRPLYDALFDMLGPETYLKYLERGQYRGRAPGLHARPHAGRQLHHPRRGPEYDPGADENVPDPPGLRLQDRHHRRHHPDRPARRTRPAA